MSMRGLVRVMGVMCIMLFALPCLIAEEGDVGTGFSIRDYYFIEPGPLVQSTLYFDGSIIDLQTESVTWPMIGSDMSDITPDEFKNMMKASRKSFEENSNKIIVSGDGPSRGLNIIFVVTDPPSGAVAALESVALYIESLFSDNVTARISVDFESMGGGIIGGTSSQYAGYVTWSDTRNGLQSDMDWDDVIQDSLPSGGTIPVRYTYGSGTVTNEDRCYFTKANYRAAIGSVSGYYIAYMTFNSDFNFDYTPPSIQYNHMCFQSIAAHETGHALGFTSGADFRTNNIEALDIYRFQRTDGGQDYDPDTYSEFRTTSRLVYLDEYPGSVSEDVNSDIITNEYRMEDGYYYQASHFDESVNAIMDPTFAYGQTFYPDFYKTPDKNMFDAIGWDYPASPPEYTLTINIYGSGSVTKDPDQSTYPEGTPVELTANADLGWFFDHWSGHLSGSDNPETIIMDGDKTVNAHFEQYQYTLTIDIDPVGYGSVTKDPDQATYTYGTNVELTAVEDTPGWVFLEWGDDLSGNDNPETITMDDDKSVIAHFVIDGHVLDLTDFPQRLASSPYDEYSGAAVAQMVLDYIWWDSDIDPTPQVKYLQADLYDTCMVYSDQDPYCDLAGVWTTIQHLRPLPYSQYGYNFTKRHNSDQNTMLKLICQWIDYTIGTIGGHEDGYPYHVPAAVPTYGDFTNWMAIRGIHTDVEAYPMPPDLTVYGFWVNDPVTGGLGANTYKIISQWNSTYYLAMLVGDYTGEYLGIFEPPESVEDCELILAEPTPRFTAEQKEHLKRIIGSDEIPEYLEKWIVQAAIDGVTEELIPFDENFESVFNSTVPGKPMFIENKNNGNYFAVPFNLPLQPKESSRTGIVDNIRKTQDVSKEKLAENTAVVILIDAEEGSFKEASWTADGVKYLPISILEAEQIASETATELGLKIKKPHPELVHRSSTPYYPEWRVIIREEKIAIYISQDGTVTVEDLVIGPAGGPMSSGEGTTPFVYSLRAASPNPFANNTTVSYSIARPGRVSLNIYDISGRLIRNLVSERKEAGVHSARWNGKDNNNRKVATGVYFTKLLSGDFVTVNKVILVR